MAASTPQQRTHLVPTHVRVPETLITLAGINLSVRQFLLILVGVALSYRLFLTLGPLTVLPAGQVGRAILTALPLGLALAFAFVRLSARALDVWCIVIARFMLRPHRFVWQSVRFHEPGLSGMLQEEEDSE